MKLAFSTLPCEDWSVEQLIGACADYGYSGIELREGIHAWGKLDTDRTIRRQAGEAMASAGIQVTDIGSGLCVKGLGDAERQQVEMVFPQLLAFAQDFGSPAIRIFLGNFMRRFDDPMVELNHECIVETIRYMCDLASEASIRVWIESHNEYATGKVLRGLLDDVNRTNCAVIWDVLHPLEDGEQPEETLRWLGKDCVHVHMKDGKPWEDPIQHDWAYTLLGEGCSPNQHIVSLLLASGYEGYFSLEWETKWRQELRVAGSEPEEVLPAYVSYMANLVNNNNHEV
ncbi:sugar phosphate isomerase/epimerase family protein [Paenibacillus qinlingensis]|uniref:sugar phosphate isomerase/epimerase family protein n=1 Tax=Paenibacillus qinlingensis TaxID=1837343 RepID=UPI0015669F7D|nr:sugar phosphate isomerase/epimerase family protein [Paenibacillus qinlingensis]NQX62771.1 sugar phosphate isomerase/epimerase [Paenibacillus qinlingensis]